MKYLSLFSGIEAATVAWHPLGWECVGVSEIEPAPCAVLSHHYPLVPNLGDVTQITETDIASLGQIDLVVFGSPCQDMSIAGNRKGFEDGSRSSLFFDAIRIIQWARKHGGCRFALWENVPGAFTSNEGRDFASVVGEMAGLGDVAVPKNGWGNEGCAVGDIGMLEWSVLDAQWFGVAQRRRRVFAIADFGDWANRAPILLECRSLRGNSAPSRKSGESITHDIAPCLTSSGRGVERAGDTRGQDAVIACFGGGNCSGSLSVSACLTAKGQRNDFEVETFAVQSNPHVDTMPTLRAGAQNGGAGHGARSGDSKDEYIIPCQPIEAYSVALRGRDGGATAEMGGDVSSTLRASGGGGDKAHVLAPIAFDSRQDCVSSSHVFGALGSSSPQAQAVVTRSYAVRRLMPVECARLQAFPDNYLSQVIVRGKLLADGPMYKMLGNSMCTKNMAWIGTRIQMVENL